MLKYWLNWILSAKLDWLGTGCDNLILTEVGSRICAILSPILRPKDKYLLTKKDWLTADWIKGLVDAPKDCNPKSVSSLVDAGTTMFFPKLILP